MDSSKKENMFFWQVVIYSVSACLSIYFYKELFKFFGV